jgi:hypothetical protein
LLNHYKLNDMYNYHFQSRYVTPSNISNFETNSIIDNIMIDMNVRKYSHIDHNMKQ